MKWNDILVAEDYQKFKAGFQKGLKGSGSYIREYRIRRRDGEIIWIQDRGQIVCGPDGQVDYISGVFFDITERRRAEEACGRARRGSPPLCGTPRHRRHARL